GASRARLKAKIAGGALMFATTSDRFNIGERNIEAVTAALRKENIPIVARDVGLNYGRTVYFYPETGIMEVKAAAKGTKQL
ncbi:MAG: chemotaxis protein CheD, partial [Oscillospiraceae bacterium]|nr:chemotaxis protein CheD [Oscillospiraceae bacterium]